jgi:hypothetical protein
LGLDGGDLRLPIREFTPLKKRKLEYGSLGFSPLVHPLDFFVCPGGKARTTGLLAAMRHYKANGTDLYFLTLDHPWGLRECILSRRLLHDRLELARAYAAAGELRNRFGATTLRVTSLESLQEKPI